jgi:transcriptional regulator with XRE-family HTH domain
LLQAKVTRTTIYFVETGRTSPSRETLQLIARQTTKPIEYFLDASSANPKGPKQVSSAD